MPKEKQTIPLAGFLEISAFVAFGLAVFLLGLSFSLQIPLPTLLSQIKESYVFPYVNSATVDEIKGVPLHYYVYSFTIFISLSALFICFLFSHRQNKPFSFKEHGRLFPQITTVMLICLASIQTVNRAQIFYAEINVFSGLSTKAKEAFIHPAHDFAQYCVDVLPGRHRCEFITDVDLTINRYLFYQRQLAYFLFPVIDIRDIYYDKPVDCLIIVKKNADQNVPQGFEIRGLLDSHHVIAVRKDSYLDNH